jgi:hypothetical protein
LITIRKYDINDKANWDKFVASAKNATFLFYRDFMEYHKDRFEDYSLLCFKKEKLVAILPANIKDNIVYSHQGLSYGGLITSKSLRLDDTLFIMVKILEFLNSNGIVKLIYKKPSTIYQELEGLQMNSILFILKAKMYRSDAYLVIESNMYNVNRNRKRAINKAINSGAKIQENKFKEFWRDILVPNLNNRFNVAPVHTINELLLLKSFFQKKIHCYTAHINNEIKAGVVVFEFDNIVHIQYSSGSDTRNEDGALDFLFDNVFKKYLDKKYISLGSCSEGEEIRKINRGLLYWKESFGAITIPQEFYEVETSNFSLIDNIYT